MIKGLVLGVSGVVLIGVACFLFLRHGPGGPLSAKVAEPPATVTRMKTERLRSNLESEGFGADAKGLATTKADFFSSSEDTMEAFFKGLPPAAPKPSALQDLMGGWKAEITAMEVGRGQGAEPVDVTGAPPFSFSVQREGERFVLKPDEPGKPARTLVADGEQVLAKGPPGVPDLRLALKDGALTGSVDLDKPLAGRMEFRAARNR